MPPQGESTGLAIEDGVLLARVFEKFPDQPLSSVHESYEKTRRPRIDIAYKDTMARWEKVRDKTWLWQKFEEWVTWIYMWYKSDDFQKSFAYDVTKEEIVT
jgi:salicylate hydroxylase